jgi:hypothetical protein
MYLVDKAIASLVKNFLYCELLVLDVPQSNVSIYKLPSSSDLISSADASIAKIIPNGLTSFAVDSKTDFISGSLIELPTLTLFGDRDNISAYGACSLSHFRRDQK